MNQFLLQNPNSTQGGLFLVLYQCSILSPFSVYGVEFDYGCYFSDSCHSGPNKSAANVVVASSISSTDTLICLRVCVTRSTTTKRQPFGVFTCSTSISFSPCPWLSTSTGSSVRNNI